MVGDPESASRSPSTTRSRPSAGELRQFADVSVEGGQAIVCLVGENIRYTPGVAGTRLRRAQRNQYPDDLARRLAARPRLRRSSGSAPKPSAACFTNFSPMLDEAVRAAVFGMNIALIGYGKMGKLIEQLAPGTASRSSSRLDGSRCIEGIDERFRGVDVAIDFSTRGRRAGDMERIAAARRQPGGRHDRLARSTDRGPRSRRKNGTGWFWRRQLLDRRECVLPLVTKPPDCSRRRSAYEAWAYEIHHRQEEGRPLRAHSCKLVEGDEGGGLRPGHRRGSATGPARIPGTHEIGFDSAADTITLRHTARSREGFAHGAYGGARWMIGRRGFYEFSQVWEEISLPGERHASCLQDVARRWSLRSSPTSRSTRRHCAGSSAARSRRASISWCPAAPPAKARRSPARSTCAWSRSRSRRPTARSRCSAARAATTPPKSSSWPASSRRWARTASSPSRPTTTSPRRKASYQHYRAIAAAIGLPIVVYSVQGRTGVNVEPATLAPARARSTTSWASRKPRATSRQMAQVIHGAGRFRGALGRRRHHDSADRARRPRRDLRGLERDSRRR